VTTRQVYVVEDEEPIRRAVQLMLRVMGYTSRAFESGVPFLQDIGVLAPGCVLLDIRMPQIDGLEVQRRLNAAGHRHSVVVMSGHGDISVAAPAFENGAVAFLEKPFPRTALQRALELAFVRLEDPARYREHLDAAKRAVAALDPIDGQILALLARGLANENIAGELALTPVALDLARSRIFDTLGVESVTEALGLSFAAARGTESS
jgi:two-component system, LuxR family, response regulator FixJ